MGNTVPTTIQNLSEKAGEVQTNQATHSGHSGPFFYNDMGVVLL